MAAVRCYVCSFATFLVLQVAELLKGKLHTGVMMAYGISGAGKTYTIEGTRTDPGVLPQALAQVFQVR